MNTPQSDSHETGGGFYTPVGTRRNFFRYVTGGIAAVIGLGLARTHASETILGLRWQSRVASNWNTSNVGLPHDH